MRVRSLANPFGILRENGGVAYSYFSPFDFKLSNSLSIKRFRLVIISTVPFVSKSRGNIFPKLVNVPSGKDMHYQISIHVSFEFLLVVMRETDFTTPFSNPYSSYG